MSETIKIGTYTFEVYQDKKGEYRWRLTAQNGNNIASANEGYSSKAAALNNAKKIGEILSQLD